MAMLRFVWNAAHAGAPDSGDYADASDVLFVRDELGQDTEVQRFAKANDDWQDAGAALVQQIGHWVAGPPRRQRVVVLVHGYSFDPNDQEKAVLNDDPYTTVFNNVAEDDGLSWVPIVGRDNAVCFAWTSAPGFGDGGRACWTNPYEYAVQDLAVLAAKALATIISALHAQGVAVDIFAHSLGTRVSSKALGRLRDRGGLTDAVRKVIMLGGAEYSIDALADTRRSAAQVYNFAIRRDGVLKWGASQLGGKQRVPNSISSRVIGRDGVKRLPYWIDFQLDHSDPDNAEEFRAWFDDLGGYKLSGRRTGGRGIHWAYYLHRDNRALYKDILETEGLSIEWMRRQAAPDGIDRFRYEGLNGRPPKTPMTCRGRHQLYDRPR